MTTTNNEPAGIDLDKLEALARAAETNIAAIARFTTTFDPAGVLQLISLARSAAHAAPAAQAVDARELVDLLRAIRPNYGAVGSRDVDVAAQQQRIDRALAILEASPAPVAAHADDARPVLTVWYGAMPESSGAQNFTATLKRKGASFFDTDSFTFARSEYPERVRYEADCMRYLIGELAERPDILAYDDAKHSGYAAPSAAPGKADAAIAGGLDTAYNRAKFSRSVVREDFEAGWNAAAGAADAKPQPPAPASGSGDAGGEVAVPKGFVLVPKKITSEMIEAAMVAHYGKRRVAAVGGAGGVSMTVNNVDYSGVDAMRNFWKGALSAAPSHAPSACQTPCAEGQSATSAADAKDAERYRWLNDQGAVFYTDDGQRHQVCESSMDDVIDAAIAASQKGGA